MVDFPNSDHPPWKIPPGVCGCCSVTWRCYHNIHCFPIQPPGFLWNYFSDLSHGEDTLLKILHALNTGFFLFSFLGVTPGSAEDTIRVNCSYMQSIYSSLWVTFPAALNSFCLVRQDDRVGILKTKTKTKFRVQKYSSGTYRACMYSYEHSLISVPHIVSRTHPDIAPVHRPTVSPSKKKKTQMQSFSSVNSALWATECVEGQDLKPRCPSSGSASEQMH